MDVLQKWGTRTCPAEAGHAEGVPGDHGSRWTIIDALTDSQNLPCSICSSAVSRSGILTTTGFSGTSGFWLAPNGSSVTVAYCRSEDMVALKRTLVELPSLRVRGSVAF